ncbi:MAG: carbohydrate porin [Planctomycetes bacterium]|nr:carbohydrate porin [Planctomycetota bacterium]
MMEYLCIAVLTMTSMVVAQSDPGMGADDPAAIAVERMRIMNTPPTGLLMSESDVHEQLSGNRFPAPTGRFPVVDQPYHQVPLFDTDPAQPISDIIAELRKKLTDPVSFEWQPMAAWTYQHATKVKPGAPHAKSLLWEAVSATLTLWENSGDYGQVSFLLQNNVGVGTPLKPYLGPQVGNPGGINNILVAPGAVVSLYWQQSFFDDTVRWRIGKISDASFFDRNVVAYNPIKGFMALDFNQSLTNPFPARGVGTTLSVDLSDNTTLRAGTLNSASTGLTSGFDGLALSHLFTICELDMRIFPEINGRPREGHLRFMGWYNAIKNPFGEGNIGGPGATFNMDQSVADHVAVFARIGWGSQDVTVSNFAASCGVAITAPFGLASSQTGIAIEYAHITPAGRARAGFFESTPGMLSATPSGVQGLGSTAFAGDPLPGGEQLMLEWYWRVRMTESTNTGPVIQVVRDPGVGIDTSVIWGWRTTITF